MKVTYDSKEDTLRILFRDAPIQESEQHRGGLVLDYDQHGGIVGIELTSASEYVSRSQRDAFHPVGTEKVNWNETTSEDSN